MFLIFKYNHIPVNSHASHVRLTHLHHFKCLTYAWAFLAYQNKNTHKKPSNRSIWMIQTSRCMFLMLLIPFLMFILLYLNYFMSYFAITLNILYFFHANQTIENAAYVPYAKSHSSENPKVDIFQKPKVSTSQVLLLQLTFLTKYLHQ